jgi:hypothetical protein
VKIRLSPAEQSALDFIGGRYEISSLILRNIDESGTVDVPDEDIANALASDGIDRVPMLSDDTPLQLAVWSIGPAE